VELLKLILLAVTTVLYNGTIFLFAVANTSAVRISLSLCLVFSTDQIKYQADASLVK
jgi:hypothetical protein